MSSGKSDAEVRWEIYRSVVGAGQINRIVDPNGPSDLDKFREIEALVFKQDPPEPE